jgi:hypothetical protein
VNIEINNTLNFFYSLKYENIPVMMPLQLFKLHCLKKNEANLLIKSYTAVVFFIMLKNVTLLLNMKIHDNDSANKDNINI